MEWYQNLEFQIRFCITESPNASETTKHYLQLFTPEPLKCYYYCLNNNYIKWGHLYNTDFLYKNIAHKQQYLVGYFQICLHQTSWDNFCSYTLIITLIYYSDISSSSVGITLFYDYYNTNHVHLLTSWKDHSNKLFVFPNYMVQGFLSAVYSKLYSK